jgi:hypothetical protein
MMLTYVRESIPLHTCEFIFNFAYISFMASNFSFHALHALHLVQQLKRIGAATTSTPNEQSMVCMRNGPSIQGGHSSIFLAKVPSITSKPRKAMRSTTNSRK